MRPTDGGVVSWMVMVWVRSVMLPQSSVARYVRVTTCGHVLPSESSEMNLTVTLPHSPVVVILVGSGEGMSPSHWSVNGPGDDTMMGPVLSCTVMVCMAVSELPQWSTAVHVR